MLNCILFYLETPFKTKKPPFTIFLFFPIFDMLYFFLQDKAIITLQRGRTMLSKNEWFQLLICFNNDDLLHISTNVSSLGSQLHYPEEILNETLILLKKYGYIWEIYEENSHYYLLTTKGKSLIYRVKEKYHTQIPYTV
ncbi:hypothetical protein HMPREF0556_10390 [Listeria grayi DSM 20601]|uniref:Uncharacterized protein n=2 Tax=Listeria grayi TaxID=1641 RepID=D7UVB5_LISGR|nr:hypothetical protein HMPREF0556_10390 [Listeria grayi DSM 20601]